MVGFHVQPFARLRPRGVTHEGRTTRAGVSKPSGAGTRDHELSVRMEPGADGESGLALFQNEA